MLHSRLFISYCVLFKSDPIHDNISEFLLFGIKNNSLSLLIAVIYCRSEASLPYSFFDCLSSYLPSYNNLLVTVDFDADLPRQ